MKKSISFFLAFFLTIFMIPLSATAATMPFKDVSTDAWYYDGVEYAYRKGLLVGTSKNQFSPNQTISRGMLAAVLHRLAGTPKPNASSYFNDVGYRTYYRDAINWADSRGIANGTSDGSFSPDAAVSREQLAAMLYRYAVLYEGMDGQISASLNNFSDASRVGKYAKKAMGWCVTKRLISGKGNNMLDPQGTATRAEVSTILFRFSQLPSVKHIGYKGVIESTVNDVGTYAKRSAYHDIDNDGTEELFLLHGRVIDPTFNLSEQIVSLYSKKGEAIISLMEDETLVVLAGGNNGEFGVVEKDGSTYVAFFCQGFSGLDESEAYWTNGTWKLYEIEEKNCVLKTTIDYEFRVHGATIVEDDKCSITLNGSKINAQTFRTWENSLKWKLKLRTL